MRTKGLLNRLHHAAEIDRVCYLREYIQALQAEQLVKHLDAEAVRQIARRLTDEVIAKAVWYPLQCELWCGDHCVRECFIRESKDTGLIALYDSLNAAKKGLEQQRGRIVTKLSRAWRVLHAIDPAARLYDKEAA